MSKTLIYFIIGAIAGGGMVYSFLKYEKPVLTILTAQEAGEKAIEFINANIQEDVRASLLDASEESGVYKIRLQIADRTYDSFVTKDGKLLFSSGIRLADQITQQSESERSERASESERASVAAADLDSFAQCLTEKGAKLYGAWWCPHSQSQKEMFGDSFQYINYIECEEDPGQSRGEMTEECRQAEIAGFPTWEFADGQKQPGETSLERLSQLSGCSLE